MIKESDGFCIISAPPEKCPHCSTKESPGIGFNKYQDGNTTDAKLVYYEIWYQCAACKRRIEEMSTEELGIWNSYPNDKQVWPKAMHHREVSGRIKGIDDVLKRNRKKNKYKDVRIVSRA